MQRNWLTVLYLSTRFVRLMGGKGDNRRVHFLLCTAFALNLCHHLARRLHSRRVFFFAMTHCVPQDMPPPTAAASLTSGVSSTLTSAAAPLSALVAETSTAAAPFNALVAATSLALPREAGGATADSDNEDVPMEAIRSSQGSLGSHMSLHNTL